MPEPARTSPRAHSDHSNLDRSWPWFAILAMGVAACGLGFWGFRIYALAAGTGDTTADLVYRTVQLFGLESGYLGGRIPWQLEVARILAPLVPAWAALQALGLLFREQRESFWLRRRKDHVIVCGLGRKGFQLVSDFRAAGEDLVVVEADADNPNVAACRDMGARVLIGSCRDISTLRRARVDRARIVVVITGDEGVNVEAAILIRKILNERGDRLAGRVKCFVHVVTLKLCHLMERDDLLSATGSGLHGRVFNSYQNSARALWETHPLDPAGFGADDPRSIHLVLFGFGQMGEAVAMQAIKLGHFANGKPLRITVVDPQADERRISFENRFPYVGDIADLELEFVTATEENQEVQRQLRDWADDPGRITRVAVCRDGDAEGLTCALTLMAALPSRAVPVHVRMSQESGLARLLESRSEKRGWTDHVHPFGMTSLNATRNILLNQRRDILARAFHRGYVHDRKVEGAAEESPSHRPWKDLGIDLQESNRQMADHLAVKLRAAGRLEGSDLAAADVSGFSPEEVEMLARMEHARWCAERFLGGWRQGATDHEARTHADLVPWEDLDESVKEYDRQAVRRIPRVLELIGG